MAILLASDQLEVAAAILARAFENEPVHQVLWPDPRQRASRATRLIRCLLRDALRYGEVQAWSANLEAVAMWMPPHRCHPSLLRLGRAGFFWLLLSEGPRFFGLSWRYHRQVMAMSRAHADARLWYLQMLGVDPDQQRKGYGSGLLSNMFARLDRAGAGCCLETSSETNVAFYQRAGFQVVDQRRIAGIELPCWFMVRRANPTVVADAG